MTTGTISKIYRNWDKFKLWHNYEWVTKSWSTIELWFRVLVDSPTSNFTVNAPSSIESWMEYVLRVKTWGTAYTMALGDWFINPRAVSLELTANTTDQYVFLAIDDSTLELQKNIS